MKKNKSNKQTTFIVVAGVLIIIVFTGILAINLLPNYESDSYYVKIEDEMSAKVEALDIKDNKLNITTSGDTVEYCVKSTRTTPDKNSICWQKITNNTASISIYKDKKYYIWIKDTTGKISIPMSINTKGDN